MLSKVLSTKACLQSNYFKKLFETEKDELNVPEYLVKITKFSTSTSN